MLIFLVRLSQIWFLRVHWYPPPPYLTDRAKLLWEHSQTALLPVVTSGQVSAGLQEFCKTGCLSETGRPLKHMMVSRDRRLEVSYRQRWRHPRGWSLWGAELERCAGRCRRSAVTYSTLHCGTRWSRLWSAGADSAGTSVRCIWERKEGILLNTTELINCLAIHFPKD